MSRATTSVPVSDSRVLTGCLVSSARISDIGRDRSMRTTSSVAASSPRRELFGGRLGQVVTGLELELLDEDALGGDLAQALPVGRARHGDRDRQAGAVPREPDDAHVVAEVLAAELGADAELAGQLEDLLLQLGVAEAVAGHGPFGRQVSRYFADAYLAVLSANSAEVPPMTMARW
jgi:hypothetical protein